MSELEAGYVEDEHVDPRQQAIGAFLSEHTDGRVVHQCEVQATFEGAEGETWTDAARATVGVFSHEGVTRWKPLHWESCFSDPRSQGLQPTGLRTEFNV